MFDIAPSELMIVAVVAIVLIGPKDLPRVMRAVGQWVGKGRAMMRHVHGAVDEMIREAEVQENAQKWQGQKARIMAEHSANTVDTVTAAAQPAVALPATERPVLVLAQG